MKRQVQAKRAPKLLTLALSLFIGFSSIAHAASAPSLVRPSAHKTESVDPTTSVAPAASASSDYTLGAGDRIRLTVYGEDDLSGEYEVSSTGSIALPLIGNVSASNQTLRHFEAAVRDKLSDGYLKDPRVSVQVMNYRPFFILGEVAKPGSYPYQNGMTVLNAVALAGGYSYRADKSGVTLTPATDAKTQKSPAEDPRDPSKERPVAETDSVHPGDVIRVPERFF